MHKLSLHKVLIQFKREFWETKASFLYAPLIMSAILVVLLVLGIIPAQHKLKQAVLDMEFSGQVNEGAPAFLHQIHRGEPVVIPAEFITHGLATIYSLFALVLLLVLVSYLVSALYGDRRDQSILFWKSLPVTERQNVLTKLGAALFAAPALYGAAAYLTGAVFLLVFTVYTSFAWDLPLPSIPHIALGYVSSILGFALGWSLLAAWMLPLFCWLLFCSALARKAPLLIAFGVPLAVVVLEAWVLGSAQVGGMLKNQVQNAVAMFQSVLHQPSVFAEQLFQSLIAPAVWAGLFLSAAFLAASVWLRTFKYEI